MKGLKCPPAQDIIIIGATGSLARTRLLPALYNLSLEGLLPEEGRVIGYARTPMADESFRKLARDAISENSRTPIEQSAWDSFASRLSYSSLDDGLKEVEELETESSRLIYLAIPPSAFPSTVEAIGRAGLAKGSRLIVEKPFGHDLKSSRELERLIHGVFEESQIFRIDHYLGKETVQNILVFRFGNAVFEKVWNRDLIDHVQVTVAESIGIEGRGTFYEETGALRDVLQNHLLQVLSLLTMEAPAVFRPETVRDEKTKLFQAMRPLRPEDVIRGQYTAGVEDGQAVPGYREEPGVATGSRTETFVAARLFIDNWRWAGVPFFIRTGKRLRRHTTEVAVVFHQPPVMFFKQTPVERLKPNMLNISIQREESISFQFLAKVPGPEIQVEPVDMQFRYEEVFKAKRADAYERLLHDAFCNDPTLFARNDVIDRAWEVVQPVLHDMPHACSYPAGTWGPEEANALISPRLWHPR
jgi:glucose-6-phosphate 1-dehydrogenase